MVGNDGRDGRDGADGAKGDKGDQGEKGDKGDTGAAGRDGVDGADGRDGIGIRSAEINSDDELVLRFSDNTTINLGKIKGEKGDKGDKGDNGSDGQNGSDGVGIETVTITDEGVLSVKLTNGTNINLGNIKGSDGIGIKRSEINSDGHLVLTYSDNTTADLGNIVGADGSDGKDGIGISDVNVLTDGTLTVSFSDGTSKSLGNIKGEKGDKGDAGKDGEKGDTGRGILKTEIIDGCLWITYTDDSKENAGSIQNTEDNSELIFVELPDGTYGVKAGEKAKNMAVINIPETYKEKSVTQICADGFKELTTIQKVVLPDGIIKIGNNAFSGCVGLNDIVFPENLETIDQYAFNGCISLTNVKLPLTLKLLGNSAFRNTAIKSIIIPYNVEKIEPYVFYNTQLTDIKFDNQNDWYIGDTKLPCTFGDGAGKYVLQIDNCQKIAECISKTTSIAYKYTYDPGLNYPKQILSGTATLHYYEKTRARR